MNSNGEYLWQEQSNDSKAFPAVLTFRSDKAELCRTVVDANDVRV